MEFLQPSKWREALEMRAAHPDAKALWGGTDVMVELNFARSRPDALLDLTRVDELSLWNAQGGWLRIGAGVSYTRVIGELGTVLPGLAMASRTVGSPQIRNRGTIGGNLGSSSPAGDALPPLYASGAEVEVESVRGSRRVPVEEFIVGPKRNVLADDELIAAVWIPAARGPQQFAKVGTRNAMVIAVCSFALDVSDGHVGTCIGSAGPTPIRARDAEAFAETLGHTLADGAAEHFGELVAAAASPIDDVRGTAVYRRHALSVLAKRTLTWAWEERLACA